MLACFVRKFQQVCYPIIKEALGSDYSDDERPQKAFKMCKEIVRSRRTYLLKKEELKKEGKGAKKNPGKTGSKRKATPANTKGKKLKPNAKPKPKPNTKPNAKPKPNTKPNAKPKPKPKPNAKNNVKKNAKNNAKPNDSDDSDDSVNVDDFFNSDSELGAGAGAGAPGDAEDKGNVAYKCIECGLSLKLHQVYPVESRFDDVNALFVRCEEHWEQHKQLKANLLAHWDKSQQARKEEKERLAEFKKADKEKDQTKKATSTRGKKPRAKKPKTTPAKKPKTTPAKKPNTRAKKPKTTPANAKTPTPFSQQNIGPHFRKSPRKSPRKAPSKPKFQLHDHVLAKWGKAFYAAQICRVASGKYDVYFPEDGETSEGLGPGDLKAVKNPKPNWAKVSRKQFVKETFMHDIMNDRGTPLKEKPGKFRVLRMGKLQMCNYYVCARVYKNGNLCKKEKHFDMGYVQKRILRQIFPFDKTFSK